MHHIDELFQWLSSVVAQRFHTEVAAIWAVQQARNTGQFSIQLRSLTSLDSSLPQHTVTNNQVVGTVEQWVKGRRSSHLEAVDNVFTAYQASLLKRYSLYYCSSHFMSGNVLLPPANNATAAECLPAPFAMTMLIFLRQVPAQDISPAVNTILEHAIQTAASRGLLLPMYSSAAQSPPAQMATPPLRRSISMEELIPRRRMDAQLLMSSNPLSGSVDIADKHARRLYAAIDGRKNIGELSSATKMTVNEAISALQKLLAQHRVEVYEPGGRAVASALLGNDG